MAQRDLSELVGLRREAGKPVIFSFLYRGFGSGRAKQTGKLPVLQRGPAVCAHQGMELINTQRQEQGQLPW